MLSAFGLLEKVKRDAIRAVSFWIPGNLIFENK
uniref:Uncharacterized protein n=1 Tax=Arundo donax TaxID=35708 RepID=A0A0A9T6Z3_ARUDO